MLFKNTARLATLVLTFPLVVPAVCSASSEHVLDACDSGNQEIFNAHVQAEYSRVVMGQAISEDGTETELKASNNSATFNSGVNVQSEVLGGKAVYQDSSDKTGIIVEADSNTIIFAQGSSFKSADDTSEARSIYGGKAGLGDDKTVTVNGTFEASENIVDIQSGAVFGPAGKITIVGGSASNEGEGSGNVSSQQNTVTINASAFAGSDDDPLEFELISAGMASVNDGQAVAGAADGQEAYKEQGNTLTITSLNNAVIGRVSAAEATSAKKNAYAIYNNATLEFGDNVQAGTVYGAYAKGSGDYYYSPTVASYNTLSLTGGQAGLVTGGYAEGFLANAYHNTGSLLNVQLNASDNDTAETAGEFSGGKAVASSSGGMATALYNRFTIEGGSFTRAFGGQAVSAYSSNTVTAENNILALTNVTAGQSSSDSSPDTSSDQYDGCLYGGYASNTATDTAGSAFDPSGRKATAGSNRLYLSGGLYQSSIYGGYAKSANEAEAGRNWVYVNYILQNVDDYNSFAPSESEISFQALYGGYAEGLTASASSNEITLYKVTGAGADIYGGRAVAAGTATASQNSVVMSGGSLGGSLYGGYAEGGGKTDASGNVITLSGVTGTGAEIYGGRAVFTASYGLATASDNTLDLYGGSYDGRIYGGYAEAAQGSAVVQNNKIRLRLSDIMSPNFNDSAVLCGGFASGSVYSSSSGNSLEFYEVKEMKAGNIENFSRLYYKYQSMYAGEHILTLTGGEATSIPDATIEISLVSLWGQGGTGEFLAGNEVVLLENADTIDIGGKYDEGIEVPGVTGVSLEYNDLVIKQTEDKTKIILTRIGDETDDESDTREEDPVDDDTDSGGTDDTGGDGGTTDSDTGTGDDSGRARGTTVNPGTKAIAEGAAAGLALVNESSNAAIELLRDFSMAQGSVTPFVHVQASSMRHETGSSINVSAVSFLAGLGTGIETGAGHLSVGAFFEYGKGSYTTHNSFDSRSDIDGDGNSWYMGGGILAKMDFAETGPGHFYVEGSAHMGTLHNEYDSNDLVHKVTGEVARFDMDSPYYSLHGGIGYVWNMAEGHDLDIYGKYIWTRVQGTDDTLTTKDRFEYDDMDSNRVRFGVRYTYKGSERFKPYVGAAFEHEFSGSCESRAFGYRVAAPSFEGSSGMGELGLMMKPTEDLPLSINLGVQGYVGQKQGISGSCNVMYEF